MSQLGTVCLWGNKKCVTLQFTVNTVTGEGQFSSDVAHKVHSRISLFFFLGQETFCFPQSCFILQWGYDFNQGLGSFASVVLICFQLEMSAINFVQCHILEYFSVADVSEALLSKRKSTVIHCYSLWIIQEVQPLCYVWHSMPDQGLRNVVFVVRFLGGCCCWLFLLLLFSLLFP